MIKKGLALEAARLGQNELELEVPPDLVAGRLGGAHAGLELITGGALSPRGSSGSLWERASAGFGAGLPRPGLAFRCVWLRP